MDILGLDLSLTSTGFATADGTGVIQSKLNGPARLIEIEGRVMELLETGEFLVALEGYSFGSQNTRAHATGELGGVIRRRLFRWEVPYVEIPPKNRAKFATGNGNAGKSEVVSATSARTGMVWAGRGGEDMCDAWLLREMGMTYLERSQFDWPKANREALDKVDWTPWPSADSLTL